jgi:hypothetical protein
MDFKKISHIDSDNIETWSNSLFLTFDIDWACDEVIEESINIVESYGVSATWFVTHDTPIIDKLRANKNFELGIHPNFNNLLKGDFSNGSNAKKVVERLLNIVPEATAVRSHSATQSSFLQNLFSEVGLTHESNLFLPEQSAIRANPWKLWSQLNIVPYCFADEVTCLYKTNSSIVDIAKGEGLRIFDFHPIHVFLNTENLERYERTREIHRKPEELIKHRYDGDGVRTALKTLLRLG